MAADLDRAYVINGDDLRIALKGINVPPNVVVNSHEAARHILGEIEVRGAVTVSREQLARALDHLWVYAKNREGTYHGQIIGPGQVADDLWENLAAVQAAPDVVDAHICCEHADGPGPFSDPEVAAMAALAPALAALRRLRYDEAMRVMRWATDRATGNLPPF